jgi:F-box/WD-40 domain protein 7
MGRGGSCLPDGGFAAAVDGARGGDMGRYEEAQVMQEGRVVQEGRVANGEGAVAGLVASESEAFLLQDAHDEIIWAIKKHGSSLLTASADATVRVWDVQSKRCRHVFDDHRRPVLSLAVTDGYICTGGYDHRIFVYENDQARSYRHLATLEGHTDAVRSLVLVDDVLCSASYDGTIRVWSLPDGNPRGGTNANPACKAVLRGHSAPVRVLATANGYLFSGSYDGTVRAWDVSTYACLATLKGHSKAVRGLTSVGRWVISGSDDTTCRVWDAQSLTCVAVLRGHTDNVRSLASTPQYVYSASWDKTIRVWSVTDWTEVACLRGHTEAVLALCVSEEQGVLCSGSFDCTVRVWNVRDGWRCTECFDVHADAVRVLEMDGDGRTSAGTSDVGRERGAADGAADGDQRPPCPVVYSGGYDGSVGVLPLICS